MSGRPVTDPGFLALVDALEAWATCQLAAAFLRGVREARSCAPYQQDAERARAIRHDMHRCGLR